MPVLSCLLVEAGSGRVELVATDLEIGIAASIPATVDRPGEVALPSRMLVEIAASLPPGPVEIGLNPDATVAIASGRARFDLLAIPPGEFPRVHWERTEPVCTVDADVLRLLARSTVFATSTDASRPVLTGVYLSAHGRELVAVATDGARLALRKARLPEPARGWTGVVPARAMSELSRLLAGLLDEVTLEAADGRLLVRLGGVRFWTGLISGSFPEYGGLVRGDYRFRVRAGLEALRDAVRRVAVTARDGANTLRLTPGRGVLVLESNTPEVGSSREEIDVSMEGTPVGVAVNARYLLEGLAAMDEEKEVTVGINDPGSPVVLTPAEEEEYAYVIAPVRIRSSDA